MQNSPAVSSKSRCVFPPLFGAPVQATTQKGVSQYAQQKFDHKDQKDETKKNNKSKTTRVSKGAKIRNRYNQVPHLTQDTNGKVTNSQLDTTNESQEISLLPAGDHKAQIIRRTQRHNKHKTEKNINDPQEKYRLGTVSRNILLGGGGGGGRGGA